VSAQPLTFAVGELVRRTSASPRRPASLRSIERHHLAGKIGFGFELVQALPVDLEKEPDGTYMASDPVFGVYGHGATVDEAFADFSTSLVEYYEIMATGANPETKRVVVHLHAYVRPEHRR
jgi:predicted RNase H-like HicB family nuclease